MSRNMGQIEFPLASHLRAASGSARLTGEKQGKQIRNG